MAVTALPLTFFSSFHHTDQQEPSLPLVEVLFVTEHLCSSPQFQVALSRDVRGCFPGEPAGTLHPFSAQLALVQQMMLARMSKNTSKRLSSLCNL